MLGIGSAVYALAALVFWATWQDSGQSLRFLPDSLELRFQDRLELEATPYRDFGELCEGLSDTRKHGQTNPCLKQGFRFFSGSKGEFPEESSHYEKYFRYLRPSRGYGNPSLIYFRGDLVVGDSYIVAFDSGEWGGGLFHCGKPRDDCQPIFFDEGKNGNFHNIQQVEKWSGGIVAIGGMNHGGSIAGYLLWLDKNEDGEWSVKGMKTLPSRPVEAGLIDGEFYIAFDRYWEQVVRLELKDE